MIFYGKRNCVGIVESTMRTGVTPVKAMIIVGPADVRGFFRVSAYFRKELFAYKFNNIKRTFFNVFADKFNSWLDVKRFGN